MSYYREIVLPILIEHAMRGEAFAEQRRIALHACTGVALEIGFGTGLNLPHYPMTVSKIIALDPVPPPQKYLDAHELDGHPPIEFIQGDAEKIPLPSASVDCVVSTWTLCSIEKPAAALTEVHRVLKPGGFFYFLEHGLSPDPWVARAQHFLTPLQMRFAGGCHLDREIDKLISASPLEVAEIEAYYMRGPHVMTYLFRGHALKSIELDGETLVEFDA
jgi:ubiquinone/menaquinone biosynthesis C-methylase UbiE